MNQIRSLQNEDENVTLDEHDMEGIAQNSFKNLLFTKDIGDMDHILAGVNMCITNSMYQMLTTKYTDDEIYLVLKGMGPTKALRAYGYPTLFFQKFWHIIDWDVSSFYLKILNEGSIDHGQRSSCLQNSTKFKKK
ncbi:hypothetical protein J1N35_004844 [Gossypium stocksii]|uniref:Uncharacterized protein n=1 Tax=Gossypium stocksii TaxID=47602 RepID=A0A9D4AI26_9ROSI|nr:hypothetical protein J1N35_004844 [Gossypium stocksii]